VVTDATGEGQSSPERLSFRWQVERLAGLLTHLNLGGLASFLASVGCGSALEAMVTRGYAFMEEEPARPPRKERLKPDESFPGKFDVKAYIFGICDGFDKRPRREFLVYFGGIGGETNSHIYAKHFC
jgi:hypothetical protein